MENAIKQNPLCSNCRIHSIFEELSLLVAPNETISEEHPNSLVTRTKKPNGGQIFTYNTCLKYRSMLFIEPRLYSRGNIYPEQYKEYLESGICPISGFCENGVDPQ